MAQRIVITGASRGIGLELARQHAARGDAVVATCRQPGVARDLTALAALHPKRVTVARLDVTDGDSIASAAKVAQDALGAVDVLWSNAGVYPGTPGTPVAEGPVGTLRAEEGLAVLATNAVGPIVLAQAFLPLLRRGDRPRLAVLSSGYGSIAENQGTPYWYGASKAALNMLHRSLAFDPAAKGVTVLLLSPGWVKTDMGGPGASTEVADSVASLLSVVDAATPEQSGAFLTRRGRPIPW
jgi:NAD(P)-dependent dehydrogenase (short-subunit alcohol dehydrogenase family)